MPSPVAGAIGAGAKHGMRSQRHQFGGVLRKSGRLTVGAIQGLKASVPDAGSG